MNNDKTTVILTERLNSYDTALLQYFHEKEKKSANCEGYQNLSSLTFAWKGFDHLAWEGFKGFDHLAWEGFDHHLDRFLPLHTTADTKEAIGADPYIHYLVPAIGL